MVKYKSILPCVWLSISSPDVLKHFSLLFQTKSDESILVRFRYRLISENSPSAPMLSNGVSLDGLSFDVMSQLEKPTPTKDRDISPRSPPAN